MCRSQHDVNCIIKWLSLLLVKNAPYFGQNLIRFPPSLPPLLNVQLTLSGEEVVNMSTAPYHKPALSCTKESKRKSPEFVSI